MFLSKQEIEEQNRNGRAFVWLKAMPLSRFISEIQRNKYQGICFCLFLEMSVQIFALILL